MTPPSTPPGLRAIAGWRRALVRRAFAEPPAAPSLRYYHAGRWNDAPPAVLEGAASPRLAILIPTLVPTGGDGGSLRRFAAGLLDSLGRLLAAPGAPACIVAVAVQDRPGQNRRESVIMELAESWQALGGAAAPLVGVAVSLPSKILALNACGALLDANGATAVAWFDDDVELMPECLPALWRQFDPAFPGVYGVRKIATPDVSRFSRLWARAKNHREPINRYPHGCGMLMARPVFGAGVPLRYITDDHYYVLRFLDPSAEDPLHLLPVVPDAVVRVPSVNAVGTALGRTARNYRNVRRVLADAPEATIRVFLKQLHFPAWRRPVSTREALSPRYWRRLAFAAGKRCYWAIAGGEILLRGLCGAPRRTVWFSAPQPRSMRAQPNKSLDG